MKRGFPILGPISCFRPCLCPGGLIHNGLSKRYHEEELGGVWGTVRQSSVKTTDVAVEDIPALRPWLRALLHTRLFPMVVRLFWLDIVHRFLCQGACTPLISLT